MKIEMSIIYCACWVLIFWLDFTNPRYKDKKWKLVLDLEIAALYFLQIILIKLAGL